MKNTQKKYNHKSISLLVIHMLVFILFVFFSVGALRQNNLTMLSLRDKVFQADINGSGVEEALYKLRKHVASHMNTDLPKLGDSKALQLKYSYERAVATEQQRFISESNLVSSNAKAACQDSISEFSRVECEQNYIKNHPVEPMRKIYPEQYSIEFVSPKWTFDLAGWALIITTILGLSLVLNILKLRYKKI